MRDSDLRDTDVALVRHADAIWHAKGRYCGITDVDPTGMNGRFAPKAALPARSVFSDAARLTGDVGSCGSSGRRQDSASVLHAAAGHVLGEFK